MGENKKFISILLTFWQMLALFWQGLSTSLWTVFVSQIFTSKLEIRKNVNGGQAGPCRTHRPSHDGERPCPVSTGALMQRIPQCYSLLLLQLLRQSTQSECPHRHRVQALRWQKLPCMEEQWDTSTFPRTQTSKDVGNTLVPFLRLESSFWLMYGLRYLAII